MSFETTESSLRALEELPGAELVTFPTEFVSKISGGIARCLGIDSKPFSIKSGNPYEIFLLEPAYIATFEIEFSKQVFGAGIEISIHDSLSNRNVRQRLQQDALSNRVIFSINCVSSGISVFLQPTFLEMFGKRTLEIKHIRILGFTPADFESLTNSLTRIQGLREAAITELSREKVDLLSRQEKVQQREIAATQLEASKKSELAELEAELDDTTSESKEALAKLVSLKDELARSETRKQTVADQITTTEATVRSIEGEVSKGKEQLRNLAISTSEAERKLRELTGNVNLFSEEFSSFSNHGAKQATMFIYLSIVPLVIIAILTAQLLFGAVDLSVKYVKHPDLDLMTVFVTRLPYLTVCGSILGVCYSVVHFLFNRISQIYAERLDFSKIGILAKDVASAASNGLELTDEQRYEARTFLKIEMLKSYLSGNIGAFTYAKREFKAENKQSSQDLPYSESDTDASKDENL